MGKLSITGVIAFFVWIGCFVDFFILSAIITKGFKEESIFLIASDLKSSGIIWLILAFLILASFGFLVFVLDSVTLVIHREIQKKRNFILTLVLIIFGILTLPIQIFFETLLPITKTKKYLLRAIFALLIFIFFVPAWIGLGFLMSYFPGQRLGLIPSTVTVAGGSMYPTFPKPLSSDPKIGERQIVGKVEMYGYPGGISLFGKGILERSVNRGDIVVFENDKTRSITKEESGEESGFIKRAVGIAGDTIEIRDGLVYVNGLISKEPYIARARSTFGGKFLEDCQVLKIPKGKIFVMGDNRKGSDDSRFDVGFIDLSEVEYVLPLKNQTGDLVKGWHDPENDSNESARITLSPTQYLSLVNNLRIKNGLKPLVYQEKLTLSSEKRGEAILRYDDFSFQASKSGYTMAKAMRDVGYSNIVYGELPANGAFEAQELFDYDVEFPNTKAFLLNKDYQEMGVTTVHGDLNNCPATIVVLQMAGYVPPNYTKDQIKSWEDLLKNLNDIKKGWQNLKDVPPIYDNSKNDVDRINEIISIRIDNLTNIVSRMESNQWLTDDQNDYLKRDSDLSDEQDKLATKINSR